MTTLDIAQLYREHRDTIVAYLLRHGCDWDLAQDLAQETFVRAMRGDYADLGKPLAWLHTIARNLLLDHRKAAAVRLVVVAGARDTDAPLFGDTPTDPGEFLASVAGRAEVVAAVRDAVGDLRPHQQRVIDLRFRCGLSMREVAAETASNEGAVKAMVSRVYRRLASDERLQAFRSQAVTV